MLNLPIALVLSAYINIFWSLIGTLKQYDHSKSSTYKVNDTEWEKIYADGATVAGVLCTDTVCVSEKCKK